MLKLSSAGATDTGRKRTNNEDAFLVLDDIRLFAVADGVGGREGGEVASRVAVETLRETLPDLLGSKDRTPVAGTEETSRETAALRSSVSLINKNILAAIQERPELSGMATTLTALFFSPSRAYIAHVGDSRAYLLRSGKLRQLTSDHSLVAEQVKAGVLTPAQANASPLRHVITRALGTVDTVQPDLREKDIRKGDVFLLCSDGLTEMVNDREIDSILGSSAPDAAAAKLIDAANRAGGVDNITVVVVKILET